MDASMQDGVTAKAVGPVGQLWRIVTNREVRVVSVSWDNKR